MKEIWEDIKGYKGLYKISNYGKVKSLYNYRGTKERILKPIKTQNRYLQINLYKNRVHKIDYVHRLVLEAFVGSCPPGMESCHNDGDPANNFVGNLRYDTHSNNNLDKRKHGTTTNPLWIDNRGVRCKASKLNDNKIIEIRQLHLEGKSDIEIAKLYCVNKTTINRIINRKIWRHIE